MTFKCEACKYNTDIKCNYQKHLKTINHNNKIKLENNCEFCFKSFNNKWNTKRHMQTCKIKKNLDASNQTAENIKNQIADTIHNTNNTNNTNIENLNININLPPMEDHYKKFYVMEFEDLLKTSISDYVRTEMNNQLKFENCDFMDFIEDITNKIRYKFSDQNSRLVNFGGYEECSKCEINEDGTVVSACREHKISHLEGVKLIVEILTRNHKNNICITSLKKFYNDKGEILIKHKNALYNLGILNKALEESTNGFMVKYDKDDVVANEFILPMYEEFFKKFKNAIDLYRRQMTRK